MKFKIFIFKFLFIEKERITYMKKIVVIFNIRYSDFLLFNIILSLINFTLVPKDYKGGFLQRTPFTNLKNKT